VTPSLMQELRKILYKNWTLETAQTHPNKEEGKKKRRHLTAKTKKEKKIHRGERQHIHRTRKHGDQDRKKRNDEDQHSRPNQATSTENSRRDASAGPREVEDSRAEKKRRPPAVNKKKPFFAVY